MKFTLVVLPDGRAILTTSRDMTEREAEAVRDAWGRWRTGSEAEVLIIPGCDVVTVHHIDLDPEVEASSP